MKFDKWESFFLLALVTAAVVSCTGQVIDAFVRINWELKDEKNHAPVTIYDLRRRY